MFGKWGLALAHLSPLSDKVLGLSGGKAAVGRLQLTGTIPQSDKVLTGPPWRHGGRRQATANGNDSTQRQGTDCASLERRRPWVGYS